MFFFSECLQLKKTAKTIMLQNDDAVVQAVSLVCDEAPKQEWQRQKTATAFFIFISF